MNNKPTDSGAPAVDAGKQPIDVPASAKFFSKRVAPPQDTATLVGGDGKPLKANNGIPLHR